MDVMVQLVLSIVIGLLGLILPILMRAIFKLKFNKQKAAIIMIPIALTSIILLYALFYCLGFDIKNFSVITLCIIAYGTFQILYVENDFSFLSVKNEVLNNTDDGVKNYKINKIHLLIIINMVLTILFISYFLLQNFKINRNYIQLKKDYETMQYNQYRKDYALTCMLYVNGILKLKPVPPLQQTSAYEMKYNIPEEKRFKVPSFMED